MRFEVNTAHVVQVRYPLYAGRWYHLAASMTTSVGAWTTEAPYQVADSDIHGLYLGYDAESGGRFAGIVDEFRLYKTALSSDAIRGMMWFLPGANSVVVPRGVLYDSMLMKQMTGNGSALLSGPLAGATVHGNDNTLSSNLNSRVIQMVIAKNLTLAEA